MNVVVLMAEPLVLTGGVYEMSNTPALCVSRGLVVLSSVGGRAGGWIPVGRAFIGR